MSDQLVIGDRVRIRTSQRVFVVAEVSPPGCTPRAPATYTLLLKPEDGKGPELLYGNAVLTRVA
jgi:hypothetical protein